MKKILIAALALAAVAACNKTEIVDQTAPYAIGFANPFVDNVTRSVNDPSTTSLTAFTAYGFMDNTSGVVFKDEPVKYDGSKWNTATTQYWVADHDYYFAAIAPILPDPTSDETSSWTLNTATASINGVGTVTFTNKDGTTDLLYASTTKSTKNITISETNPGTVDFTFNHLLSKVKFGFTNGFANENTSIIVKNVTLAVPASGSINLGAENWWEGDKWAATEEHDLTLKFGDIVVPVVDAAGASSVQDENGDNVYPNTTTAESYNERLTIPTEYRTYRITFTAELYQGGTLAGTYNHVATVDGIRFEMGHAYKFTATLDGTNIDPESSLFPITFSVEKINGWDTTAPDYGGGVLDTVANN